MLEILLLIFIARYFNRYAKDHQLSAVLWTIMPIVSYILGALIGGVIVAVLAPDVLENTVMLSVIGLPAGTLGIFVCYLIMRSQAKSKADVSSADVLDDEIL